MVDIKYNLSTMKAIDNPVWGVMIEVNNATNHYFVYSILALVFSVASYVFIRKTNDIPKSLLSSLHITTILTILLYYAGKVQGIIFVDDIVILGLIVTEALAIAGLYYVKNKKTY